MLRLRILVFLFALLPSIRLLACSCGDLPSLSYADLQMDYVLIGVVVSDTQLVTHGGEPVQSVGVFRPLYWFSDSTGHREVVIRSNTSSNCGITFKTGEVYLLFSNGSISLCSRYERLSLSGWPGNTAEEKIMAMVKGDKTLQELETMARWPHTGRIDTFFVHGQWERGQKHGRWDYEDPDELWIRMEGAPPPPRKIVQTCFYTYGQLDSMITCSGSWTYKHHYRNGREYGWQTNYDGNGLRQRYYVDEEGKTTWNYTYDKGVLTSAGGWEDGVYKFRSYDYRTGILKRVRWKDTLSECMHIEEYRTDGALYLQGLLRTEKVAWYNREIFYLVNYWDYKGRQVVKDGNGHWVDWHNDTVKAMDVWVTNGILHGSCTRWRPDGSVYYKVELGKPQGEHMYGRVPVASISENYGCRWALPVAPECWYNSDGSLSLVRAYNWGTYTERATHYTDGKVSSEYEGTCYPMSRWEPMPLR